MKDRIKRLRKQHGLTQGQLGEILGIKQETVSGIERGDNNPTVHQVEALSRYFGVSADYLLFGVDNASTAFEVTPTEREILRLIKEDSGLMNSLITALTAKKNIQNRLAA